MIYLKYQTVPISEIAQERTLRQDVDYHQYNHRLNNEYYKFSDLFVIVDDEKITTDNLFQPFQYCEIGDTDKDGEIYPVELDFSQRNLLDENYYKKIEKGDILSVKENDILIAKVRPNLKKYIRITSSIKNIYFTSAFIHIRAKSMPEIMYYCFRNTFYSDLMAISRQGKGYPTLSENDLVTLRFDKSIIDVLFRNRDSLVAHIHSIENEIKILKEGIKTHKDIIDFTFKKEFNWDYEVFDSLRKIKCYNSQYSVFSNNPDLRFSAKFHRDAGSFVMKQLTAITDKKIKHFLAEPIILGASISPNDYSDDGDYQYISMATIKNWMFDSESANYVSKEYSDSKVAKTVRKNDIILARSGEGTIGKVALIDDDNVNGVFADFTMRIRLKDYNPEFAYYYFRTSYFQYLIEVFKKGLGNNTNIFPVVIQEFPLIDISLDEQQRIVDEIHAEIAKQEEIKSKIEKLRNQIDSTIEEAISRGVK